MLLCCLMCGVYIELNITLCSLKVSCMLVVKIKEKRDLEKWPLEKF